MFSSRSVVFLGLGGLDPHLALLLTASNELANGMPVTHYAVMATTDRFEIDALERKFGIELRPTSRQHRIIPKCFTSSRACAVL